MSCLPSTATGSGRSRTSSTSGPPNSVIWIARIRLCTPRRSSELTRYGAGDAPYRVSSDERRGVHSRMRAIQITEFGGPEVLGVRDLPDPVAVDGMQLIEVTAAGVNYADTHQTENSYLARQQLPLIPGAEVAGRTPDGRRVVALVGGGGYAEKVLAPPETVFDVPVGVSDGQALALVLQGTTAWHILRTSAHLAVGESVVVHAAAGGVGSLAVQLAQLWGAGRVIATASGDDKRELGPAGRPGCPHRRRPRAPRRSRPRPGAPRSAGCARPSCLAAPARAPGRPAGPALG